MKLQFSKYICCTLDLTIASRIIAFLGMTISVLLLTIFFNDNANSTNYDLSRKTALAFGLDWQHFHKKASIALENDPEGRMITVVVIFYSSLFLIINLMLFYATIRDDSYFSFPWLICEFIGCSSKVGALIYHMNCDPYDLGKIFVIGSIIYIVVMIWWWLVIFCAQFSSKGKESDNYDIEMSTTISHSHKRLFEDDSLIVISPGPYHFTKYAEI